MCFRTFFFTCNIFMFGISIVTIGFMAGVFKENRRIAVTSIPANCQMAVGSAAELETNWIDEIKPVKLSRR